MRVHAHGSASASARQLHGFRIDLRFRRCGSCDLTISASVTDMIVSTIAMKTNVRWRININAERFANIIRARARSSSVCFFFFARGGNRENTNYADE